MNKTSALIAIIITFTCSGCDILYSFDDNEYNITYHLEDGTNADNPFVYTKDMGPIELKNPTKASCTFKGWYLDSDFNSEITKLDYKVKNDLELYAKWVNGVVESSYTIDLGLKKEYTLFHISDTHINAGTTEYDLELEKLRVGSFRINYAQAFKEEYDLNYICKESKEGLTRLVDYLNNENPYAVCYSGDIMDYYSVANYEYVLNELGRTNVPYVYAIGNHETPSSNYGNLPGIDTTSFTVLEFKEFEIVCMDNSSGFYTQEQYNKLIEETNKKKPIIIVQHIPLITENNLDSKLFYLDSYFWIKTFDSKENQQMVEFISSNKYIKLVLCGHIHGEVYSEIAPGKPQITCSSGLMGHINKIIIK